MAAARALLLLALLTLFPGVAVAQVRAVTPPVITPSTPPPATIPSAPAVAAPAPVSPALRPVQTFVLRPTLDLTEEYTDNFNRSERRPITNLRSTIAPGLAVIIDRGFLTGEADYSLSLFHDTSAEDVGYFHSFGGRFSWEATPRFAINGAYTLSQS